MDAICSFWVLNPLRAPDGNPGRTPVSKMIGSPPIGVRAQVTAGGAGTCCFYAVLGCPEAADIFYSSLRRGACSTEPDTRYGLEP